MCCFFETPAERSSVCAMLLSLALDRGASTSSSTSTEADQALADDAMMCLVFVLEGSEVHERAACRGGGDTAFSPRRLTVLVQFLRSPHRPDITVYGANVAKKKARVRSEVTSTLLAQVVIAGRMTRPCNACVGPPHRSPFDCSCRSGAWTLQVPRTT